MNVTLSLLNIHCQASIYVDDIRSSTYSMYSFLILPGFSTKIFYFNSIYLFQSHSNEKDKIGSHRRTFRILICDRPWLTFFALVYVPVYV